MPDIDKKQLTERDICTKYILPAVKKAGWNIHTQIREEVPLTAGRVIVRGQMATRTNGKRADFVLYHKPNIPLAIIEAKRNTKPIADGMQQGLSYADLLEVPFIFSSNGDGFIFHDKTGLSSQIETELSLDEFPSHTELWKKFQQWKGYLPNQLPTITQDYYEDGSGKTPLFDKCAITTNFDIVAEEAYKIDNSPFNTTAVGLHDEFTFLTSVPKGSRCLLKLHGNINNHNHRVLTHDEYEEAYGENDSISFNNHIPKLLKRIYLSYSLFFIGCSMNSDRTVKTFEKIVEEETAQKVPDHYALLEQPEDDDEFTALRDRMIACNIKPIWYPNKEYHLVDDLLSLLKI